MNDERRTLHKLANLLTVASGALERGRGFPGLGLPPGEGAAPLDPAREAALDDAADALREAAGVLRRRVGELAQESSKAGPNGEPG